jgi:hypothetical protein
MKMISALVNLTDIVTEGRLIRYVCFVCVVVCIGWIGVHFAVMADMPRADDPVLEQRTLSMRGGLLDQASASHLVGVEKSVIPKGRIAYGDELTYTVVITAVPGTPVRLYDPLADVNFKRFTEQPPGITYTQMTSGSLRVDVITGTLTFSSTSAMTVSFVAQMDVPGTLGWSVMVTNRACAYPFGGTLGDRVCSNEVSNVAYRPFYTLYLPGVLKSFSTSGYYVDCANGNDANSGTSPGDAWRTLAPVCATQFEPGSVIHLKRGCTWSGGLVIDDSGEAGNPITFTAYGEGERPIITNPGNADRWTNGITVNADWVIITDLLVQDVHRAGFMVNGNRNIIRNVEVTDVGSGVSIWGAHNLVTECYIHDLHMIKNTPGGNDDFGATGIKFYGSYNEVAHNRIERCRAPSYDYGIGGGAFEWFGHTHNNTVRHNWAADNDGFLEVGGGSCRNTVVAYNVSLNNGVFSWIHLSGPFASEVENFYVEHNTMVEVVRVEGSGRLFNFHDGDNVTQDVFIARNNIIYLRNFWAVSNRPGLAHYNNLYHLDGGPLGFPLGPGEQITDPRFADLDGRDFRLQSSSPAIDAGTDLGYDKDLMGNPVPVNNAPDLGAFEYPGVPQRPPTPTPVPTPTPLPTPSPTEIIVDDADPGFLTSFSQDDWQQYTHVGGQHYGATHYYNREIGTGEDTATWSFTVPQSGRYEVYAWWWEGVWRPTDVPYTINHLEGSTTVRVDQQNNGEHWNLLGTFAFQDQGSVMVSDDVSSGRDVVADAVRLVYVGP